MQSPLLRELSADVSALDVLLTELRASSGQPRFVEVQVGCVEAGQRTPWRAS